MLYIYIIYSESWDNYYIGYSNDPFRRLEEHNTKPFNTYTSKHRPWRLEAIFICSQDEKEAMGIERFIEQEELSPYLTTTFSLKFPPFKM